MNNELETTEKEFIDGLKEKITFLNDKIVVFDLDGVLCKFKYTDDYNYNLLPCEDKVEVVNKYGENNDFYKYGKPNKIMQYIISKLNMENVYILSMTQENIRKWKTNWINSNYEKIKKENIIYTYNVDEKLEYLRNLKAKYTDKEIVFVEDRAETLIKVNEEKIDIICIHISSFF